MTEFEPGALGYLQVWLIGGPLDGISFGDMPAFPAGAPALGLAVPLDSYGQPGLFGSYVRREKPALDGRWYYDFTAVTADPAQVSPAHLPSGTVLNVASEVEEDLETDGDQPDNHLAPAPRFVLAQAWWIASELCRRNSRLRILDAWPLDGFYHGLEVGEKINEDHIFMNFLGSIHMFPSPNMSLPTIHWRKAIGAESPHELVKEIELQMNWETSEADATTARTLTYRAIAFLLNAHLNDRERWKVEAAHSVGGFVEWPELLDQYRGCRLALQKDTIASPPPSTRVWVISRGTRVIALLSDMGLLFSKDKDPVDLMKLYKRRRDLSDVTHVIWGKA